MVLLFAFIAVMSIPRTCNLSSKIALVTDAYSPRDFLAGSWSMDILSQEGFDKMKEIVNDILVSVAAL